MNSTSTELFSIIGLTGLIVKIVVLANRIIWALRTLQQRWNIAHLAVCRLISQLTPAKAVLSRLRLQLRRDAALSHYES